MTKSVGTYAETLGILYMVFECAYNELANIDFQPRQIDLESIGHRRKWLADDLRALAKALPNPQSLGFELPTSGHGFGCLYVLEGSALGGRVISKRVKLTLGLGPGTGGDLLSWAWPADGKPLVGFPHCSEHDFGEFGDGQ